MGNVKLKGAAFAAALAMALGLAACGGTSSAPSHDSDGASSDASASVQAASSGASASSEASAASASSASAEASSGASAAAEAALGETASDEADSAEAEQVDTVLVAGSVSNGVYNNAFFGVGWELPEDWTVAGQDDATQGEADQTDADEGAAGDEVVEDEAAATAESDAEDPDEEEAGQDEPAGQGQSGQSASAETLSEADKAAAVDALLESGSAYVDLSVSSPDALNNVMATITSTNTGVDAEAALQTVVDSTAKSLEDQGFQNVDVEMTTLQFCGQDVPCASFSYELQSVPVFQKVIALQSDGYVYSVAATCGQTDITDYLLSLFSAI